MNLENQKLREWGWDNNLCFFINVHFDIARVPSIMCMHLNHITIDLFTNACCTSVYFDVHPPFLIHIASITCILACMRVAMTSWTCPTMSRVQLNAISRGTSHVPLCFLVFSFFVHVIILVFFVLTVCGLVIGVLGVTRHRVTSL
jgi:hypothetical protein